MIIVGLDFETTGLTAASDVITEAGAVLWDTDKNTPVLLYNKFINTGTVISKLIVDKTGITTEMLSTYGVSELEVCMELNSILEKCEYIVAHNAPFDKSFYLAICERCNLLPVDRIWLDTSRDIEFDDKINTSRKLVHLAAEHGFVNPFAHRAVTDVLTMLQLLGKYDIKEVIESAISEKITIAANTGYEQKELARDAGFKWESSIKAWIKIIKKNMLDKEIEKCGLAGFTIREIGNVSK